MHLFAFLIAQAPVPDTGGNDNELLKKFILDENGGHERLEGFLAPSGRFRVKVPQNFHQEETNDPDTITFAGDMGGGSMQIIFRRVTVTPGASPAQLMLVTRDRFQQKLPGFTVLRTERVKIANRPCAWMLGRYDYQGNRGYSMVIENAYIIDGADGFIIHSEIPEAVYQDAQQTLNDMYRSFRTIAPQPEKPVAPPPAPKSEPAQKGKKKK